MTCEIILDRVGGHSYDILVITPSGSHFIQGFYSPLDFSFFTLIGRR